ncbi:MAG: flagellar basal body P-ring protein FlgI [Planctomycetales bacterium]|nr:flagellar basal body P-ring protein FlgI [Planctomycetales bacterium]
MLIADANWIFASFSGEQMVIKDDRTTGEIGLRRAALMSRLIAACQMETTTRLWGRCGLVGPRRAAAVLGMALLLMGGRAQADVRIKDITTIEGQRVNRLTGLGLVVGLAGTGGKSEATRRTALNLFQAHGLRATPLERVGAATNTQLKTENMSVVMVSAEMPVNARMGTRLTVRVASADDAKSLLGGVLIDTPLHGVHDVIYAMAAGPVSTGAVAFSGDGASVQKNHPTVGLITDGAIIEDEIPHVPARLGRFRLLVRRADFETSRRIAGAINQRYPGTAESLGPGAIEVMVPFQFQHDETGFMADVQLLRVQPDLAAMVVINERTGTVVVGQHVRISKVALTHANLTVVTSESPQVSQPAPLSEGQTAVVPRTDLQVVEEKRSVNVVDDTVTVADVAAALNALGATSRDLSSIFQALYDKGALHAELDYQ